MDKSGDAAENWTTSPELSLGLDATELESAVLLQQILVLYESHWFLLFNVTNAALTAFVLRDLLPVRMFVGWVGLFCIVILARLLNHKLIFAGRRKCERPPTGVGAMRPARLPRDAFGD